MKQARSPPYLQQSSRGDRNQSRQDVSSLIGLRLCKDNIETEPVTVHLSNYPYELRQEAQQKQSEGCLTAALARVPGCCKEKAKG